MNRPPVLVAGGGIGGLSVALTIMAFTSIEALRAYQRHPQQLAVMAFNDAFVAHVASVDFTRTELNGGSDGSVHYRPAGL